MEYRLEDYRRQNGRIFQTPDGHKYYKSKVRENNVYLRCVLFRNGCKATAKLNLVSNLITPAINHNHSIIEYQSDVYELKSKFKNRARNSQDNLKKIFDDVTREDAAAFHVSFAECESSMYRSRRALQPKIPTSPAEFSDMLPNSIYGTFYRCTVSINDHTAIIFFSDNIRTFLSQITNIQFDGTFYTVPVLFYQLWTIFLTVDRHTLPGIHCLMTGKNEELYKAILIHIHQLLPELQPTTSMSDWEAAPRKALKEVFPNIKLFGCWFHFTQRIWYKTQKLGLTESFKDNIEVARYIRQLMSIPFLPASLIHPTYSLLQFPATIIPTEAMKLEKLNKYFKKRWITHVNPEELSIFDSDFTTNNGAESYHARLKDRIRANHPRVWNFMTHINEIIMDTDNEFGRLSLGKDITRPRKKTNILTDDRRSRCKQKFQSGCYTPWEYINAVSQTIGNIRDVQGEVEFSDCSEDSETDDIDGDDNTHQNCVVCLNSRTSTWIFLPCRHAQCCMECCKKIEELGQSCPVCRSPIESSFEIFTN